MIEEEVCHEERGIGAREVRHEEEWGNGAGEVHHEEWESRGGRGCGGGNEKDMLLKTNSHPSLSMECVP